MGKVFYDEYESEITEMIREIFRYLKRLLPDKIYLEMQYYRAIGKKLNLKNPRSYTEKLQWLKLYDRKPIYTQMVDKYEVKKYIANTIGKQYLIETIGIYDNIKDIDWDILPEKYVVKCTHDSKSTLICRDKSKFDIKRAEKLLSKCMRTNGYWFGREWPYKNVKPRIIVEELLQEKNQEDSSLIDYKVMCFEGKARLIQVLQGRFSGILYQDFYTTNWEKTTIQQSSEINHPEILSKPGCLDEMIEKSEFLARNIHHVRVDWYIVNNKLYFGELTFFDSSGFDYFVDYKDDLLLGSWIEL